MFEQFVESTPDFSNFCPVFQTISDHSNGRVGRHIFSDGTGTGQATEHRQYGEWMVAVFIGWLTADLGKGWLRSSWYPPFFTRENVQEGLNIHIGIAGRHGVSLSSSTHPAAL